MFKKYICIIMPYLYLDLLEITMRIT